MDVKNVRAVKHLKIVILLNYSNVLIHSSCWLMVINHGLLGISCYL